MHTLEENLPELCYELEIVAKDEVSKFFLG
jgi:hypothetical protein